MLGFLLLLGILELSKLLFKLGIQFQVFDNPPLHLCGEHSIAQGQGYDLWLSNTHKE